MISEFILISGLTSESLRFVCRAFDPNRMILFQNKNSNLVKQIKTGVRGAPSRCQFKSSPLKISVSHGWNRSCDCAFVSVNVNKCQVASQSQQVHFFYIIIVIIILRSLKVCQTNVLKKKSIMKPGRSRS